MTTISQGRIGSSLESRIADHVGAWDKARKDGFPLAVEVCPFVTISREFGCEAVPLAHQLVDVLNECCRPSFPWLAYDRDLIDKVSE